MYRFALRPRWIALHVLLLVIVSAFVAAGLWQLHRLEERRERNLLIAERYAAPEADLDRVLARPEEAVHRRVRAEGTYDTSEEVLLFGRGAAGRPGHHLLTPLVTDGGTAIVVDRGWVPPHLESPPVAEAAPAPGPVVVHGVLAAGEGGSGRGPTRRLSRIDLERLGAQLPYEIHPVYLLLAEQDPPPDELPEPVQRPEADEGPHLVYAVQWFLFTAIALGGYGAILRREARKGASSHQGAPPA